MREGERKEREGERGRERGGREREREREGERESSETYTHAHASAFTPHTTSRHAHTLCPYYYVLYTHPERDQCYNESRQSVPDASSGPGQ